MILEFQVRQGKIVDRTEELYRPRSASPTKVLDPEEQAPRRVDGGLSNVKAGAGSSDH